MRIQTETNLAKRILCFALCAIMLIAMVPASTTVAHATELPESAVLVVWYATINDGGNVYDCPYDGRLWLYSELMEGGSLQSLSDYIASIKPIGADDAVYICNNPDGDMFFSQSDTDTEGVYYYYDLDVVDDSKYTWTSADPTATVPITNGQGQLAVYKIVSPEAVDYSCAEFQTVLLLDANASVPASTINYSIAPGTGIAAVPGTSMSVLAPSTDTGVTGTPTISNAVFAPGDATVTSVEGVTIDAGEKAVVKPISIDFSGVSFAQPGIFRYVISEPSSGNNMTYDTQLNDTTNGTRYQRVLDVYVVRNASNEYEIGGYVMHEVANAPAEGTTAASDKSSGFVNEYNTSGITLECLVTGNQSSVEKYFKFNVAITNPGGSQFSSAIDWSNAAEAKNPVENPATTYSQSDIASANEANTWTSTSAGVLEKVVYLKHGQKIEIPGLPIGATYHIDVLEEDYGPTWDIKIDGTVKDQPAGSDPLDDTENQTLGERTEDVRFILTRDGVVPTGIMLSAMPGVIIMGAAAAVLFVMKNRKKEEGAEA